ncbi:HNH endonuclease [Arthrobacter phage AbbyDaisy]|nr:HNH endonuclease [Arthrobacter phage AbbyDaisy]
MATAAKQQAFEQGLMRCPRCRVMLDWEYSKRPNSPEADHIKPYAQGGADTIENTRIICRKCNQELGGAMRKRERPVIQTTELESSPIW